MPKGQRHLTYGERCRIHATGKGGLSGAASLTGAVPGERTGRRTGLSGCGRATPSLRPGGALRRPEVPVRLGSEGTGAVPARNRGAGRCASEWRRGWLFDTDGKSCAQRLSISMLAYLLRLPADPDAGDQTV